MPCNPAIGGTAKGHLVREIDALGGLMGRAIDATGIQFKLLNRSRGPAVWSPRAQADKRRYGAWVAAALDAEPNIEWMIGKAGRVLARGRPGRRPRARGRPSIRLPALVVTTGTFLNGLIHVGPEQRPAGRAGEPPSHDLAESLKVVRLPLGPAEDRHAAAARSAEHRFLAVSSARAGDDPPVPFSFLTDRDRSAADRLLSAPHDRARSRARAAHIDESPLFNGQIKGIGPRYCPSLEDKIMRFPDRERHQIFLEPEGLDVDEIYVNGFSMSLPAAVQAELVHALPGLEDAVLLRPGYAVEYDFIQPTELDSRRSRRSAFPGCFSPGRSTARPATRRRRRRGWSPASTPPDGVGPSRDRLRPRRELHRDPRRRPDHQGLPRAVPDVHVARRASPAAAHRQRRSPPHARRPGSGPGGRRAMGAVPERDASAWTTTGRWFDASRWSSAASGCRRSAR